MTLTVRITQVTVIYPLKIFIQWDLTHPTESGLYLFKVERCPSTDGPWDVLVEGLQNTYNYIDDFQNQAAYPDDGKPHLFSNQTQFYYRITVTPPSGCSNNVTSDSHGLDIELNPIQRGLRRKICYEENILWRRFNGVRLALLRRKHWGVRCSECYDPVTKATTREHCPICYGTSFVGGYWNPVVVYGRVNTPRNVIADKSPVGTSETTPQTITIPDAPALMDLDLIVEIATNIRHLVLRHAQTEITRRSIHQQLQTAVLEPNSVEYRIPVDTRIAPPMW